MADLKDFYPVQVQPSPRGDGAPANPGITGAGGVASAVTGKTGDPAIWVLVFAGLALFLLHKA